MEIFVSGKSLPQAYHRALAQLKYQGEIVPCPAWNTSCLEAGMTIYIEEPLAEPMISKCFIGGPAELQQYIMEMLDGILDFEIERGNWAYTYHDRMVHYGEYNQIDFVVNELTSDPDSRRAVIMIRIRTILDQMIPLVYSIFNILFVAESSIAKFYSEATTLVKLIL